MFSREKRLSRSELLDMLVQLSEENDSLRDENDKLRAQLNDKSIVMGEAGSIAEASLRLSGVFEAAQEAADSYLSNIKAKSQGVAANVIGVRTTQDAGGMESKEPAPHQGPKEEAQTSQATQASTAFGNAAIAHLDMKSELDSVVPAVTSPTGQAVAAAADADTSSPAHIRLWKDD